MRAQKNSYHISGAERIISSTDIHKTAETLLSRALTHSRGEADEIFLSLKKINEKLIEIPALPVVESHARNNEEAKFILMKELDRLGISGQECLKLLFSIKDMRGAILLDYHTLERLEADKKRGIRVSALDYAGERSPKKAHLPEALALATKVLHHPDILAEICISDDPDYTTGYLATKRRGYLRIPHIKEKNFPYGGRIFLYTGLREELNKCVNYLEKTPVLVKIPPKLSSNLSFTPGKTHEF